MKLLLCSPYLQLPGIIPGGINVWANNILKYRETVESDINVIPVSFDRRNYVSVDSNIVKRMYLGVKEYFSAIKDAIGKMDSEKPEVMHVCTSASISLTKDIILVNAARKRHIKSIVHFHFGRIQELARKQNWEWKLVKRIVHTADAIVTMDMKSYQTLTGLGYKNIHYCPNPLSMAVMSQIQKEKSIVERIPGKLLFVGHVLPSKGVYELMNACKQFDGIELHIIGKAEEPVRSELLQMASEKDGGTWLKMRGEIPHDEVLREMMSAVAFVFPSYTEGFPNVILEAMACGCPIVTTTVGAIPEMLDIEHGFNHGICVAPQNAHAFAEGLRKMISDPSYASACAEKAEKRVNEMYAVPVVWEQLSNIWRNVCCQEK